MSLHLWINAFETSLSPIRFVFSYYLLLLHLECLLCHKVLAWKSTHIRCGTQTYRCDKIKSLTCLFLDDKLPARLNCLLWSSSMGHFTEYEYYEAFRVWSQAWYVSYKDTLWIHFDFRDVHWCSPFGQGHHKCFHTNRLFVSPQRCLSFWSSGPWDDFVAGKLLFVCPSFFFFSLLYVGWFSISVSFIQCVERGKKYANLAGTLVSPRLCTTDTIRPCQHVLSSPFVSHLISRLTTRSLCSLPNCWSRSKL